MTSRPAGALAALAVVGTLVSSSLHASAAPTSVAAGWWSASPSVTSADVPDGGLVAQGGPSAPSAYAAVAFQLDAGDDVASLRLVIAPGSLSVPTSPLAACPLVDGFTPADGGAIADAPAYDCGGGVPGTATADGSAFEFDLSALPSRDSEVAVAIVPLGPTARVVFEPPGLDALSLAQRASTPGGREAVDAPASVPTIQPPVASGGGGPTPPAPGRAASTRAAATPATPVVPSSPVTSGSAPPSSTPAVAAPVTTPAAITTGSEGSPLLLVLFVGLVVLTVLLWTATGSRKPQPRPAHRFRS